MFARDSDMNFFSLLTDHFGTCLDHIAINLQMSIQGLNLHLWGSRVTELDHEKLLLLLS